MFIGAAALQGWGGAGDVGTVHDVILEATAFSCDTVDDGVCLAYGGSVPGPTLDVRLGDTLQVTLVNRIAETVALLDATPETKALLANATISFHTHGMTLPANMDGLDAHAGTNFQPSVARPGGAFTYTMRAGLVGPWHYHDHTFGIDGSEGTLRGLFGAIPVRGGAEPVPDHVLDLHVHDNGVNGGQGLDAAVAVGDSFELLLSGLGSFVWTVQVTDPAGATLYANDIGPGISERVKVTSAVAGAYDWSVRFGPYTYAGQVVAS